jgi:3-methyladenine DNA glycosylase Tag
MLEGLTPKIPVRNCAVRSILATLDEDDRKILESAINDALVWKSETLSKALNERGIVVSGKTITYHRSEACSCFKA